MRITTRSRVAFLIAVAALVVAAVAGSQLGSAGSQEDASGGSPPSSGGGAGGTCLAVDEGGPETPCDDTGSTICAAPQGGATTADDCDDKVGLPLECGEQTIGTGPAAVVGYTPCPGDDDGALPDPDDGAQLVEPTPGMTGVRPHGFDHEVVGKDGTTVTIFFWSGVEPCYVLDHVDVEYGAQTVTITLYEGHDASAGDVACIEIAMLKKVEVRLDEPVGDREIADGASAK